MPLPSLRWLNLPKGVLLGPSWASRRCSPHLVPRGVVQDDEDDPEEDRSPDESDHTGNHKRAAMTHKMVSVLPPPFAASIPRLRTCHLPSSCGNNTRVSEGAPLGCPRRARGMTPAGGRPGGRQAGHPGALWRRHPRERRTGAGEGARPPHHPLGARRTHWGEGGRQ